MQGIFFLKNKQKSPIIEMTLNPRYAKNVTTRSDQTQAPTRPNVESHNLRCLFTKRCSNVNVLKIQSFEAYAVEMNLTWNLI